MSSHTVAITGAGGFVGKYLIEELQQHSSNTSIIGVDTKLDTMPETIERHVADITKPESYISILQYAQPDWIIHLAAVSSVGFAIEHPEITKLVNIDGTRMLLEAVRAHTPNTKVLIISSSDIYGHVDATPTIEKPLAACSPTNPYAQSKLEIEKLVEQDFNDICIRVRPFPHIGPMQKTGFVTADFASQIARIEKREQEPVMQVGNLTAVRDFTDVRDVVRAYRLLMESGVLGEVYNIASGVGTTIQTILDQLLAMSEVEIRVEQDQARMRPSDNPVIIGNSDKVTNVTGWKSEIRLEKSLQDILNYWRTV
ncbi:MAG: GDP-mannose 4,6-dehydratase [Candidatus Andersenbacteria bacterium]